MPTTSEPNIWRFNDRNYRVTVAKIAGGVWQQNFTNLPAARAWRDAKLELHRAARQPGAYKAKKSVSAVQGFPVGTYPCVVVRQNKNGTMRTFLLMRSTLNLNTGRKKTFSSKYGANRTIEEALAIVLEKRKAFVQENPRLFD